MAKAQKALTQCYIYRVGVIYRVGDIYRVGVIYRVGITGT